MDPTPLAHHPSPELRGMPGGPEDKKTLTKTVSTTKKNRQVLLLINPIIIAYNFVQHSLEAESKSFNTRCLSDAANLIIS